MEAKKLRIYVVYGDLHLHNKSWPNKINVFNFVVDKYGSKDMDKVLEDNMDDDGKEAIR